MVVADGKRWKVTAFLTKTAENAAWILSSQGQVIGYRAEKKDEESKDFAAADVNACAWYDQEWEPTAQPVANTVAQP
jgi:hypothetical protein